MIDSGLNRNSFDLELIRDQKNIKLQMKAKNIHGWLNNGLGIMGVLEWLDMLDGG